MNNTFQLLLKKQLLSSWLENSELQKLTESNNNDVYIYWKYIIKINKIKSKLFLEFNLLTSLWNDLIIPKALLFSFFEYFWKKYYYLVLERLNGRNVDYEWKLLSNMEKNNLVSKIVQNLSIINNYSIHDFSFARKKYSLSNQIFTNYSKLQSNPFADKLFIDKLYNDYKQLITKISWEQDWFLVHNDIWYKNILVFNWQLSWIVDFELSIFAPKEFELFKIIQHKFCAQNYIDNWSTDYTELEFVELLLKTIWKNYFEILEIDNIWEKFYLYNINTYFTMLTRYKKKYYSQKHCDLFANQLCDLDKCKKILREIRV